MKYVAIKIETAETSETIQIEEATFIEAKRIIEAQGITIERAIELFFKHIVEHGMPFTQEEIQAYKDEQVQRSANVRFLPTIERMKHIDFDYITNHLEEVLELCNAENIICIERDGKPDLVMMIIQAYEDWTGEKVELPDDYKNE